MRIRQPFINKLLTGTALSAVLLCTTPLHAQTVIMNSISAQATSGGNTATNGETIQGRTESTVDIQTSINGEVVNEVHETSSTGYVHVEQAVSVSDDGDADIQSSVDFQKPKMEDSSNEYVWKHRINDSEGSTSSSTIITNINRVSSGTPSSTDAKDLRSTYVFSRFFTNFSNKVAYVLSNFFSIPKFLQ